MIKNSRGLVDGFPHPKSPPAKFGCHRCCWSADISFLIFHVTTWSKDMWLGGLDPATLGYYSAKFGDYRYGGNAVIRIFISRVTTWWKADMLVGSPYRKLPLCQVCCHRYRGSADVSFYYLPHDHVIKKSRDLVDGVFWRWVTTLPSLVDIDAAEVQI